MQRLADQLKGDRIIIIIPGIEGDSHFTAAFRHPVHSVADHRQGIGRFRGRGQRLGNLGNLLFHRRRNRRCFFLWPEIIEGDAADKQQTTDNDRSGNFHECSGCKGEKFFPRLLAGCLGLGHGISRRGNRCIAGGYPVRCRGHVINFQEIIFAGRKVVRLHRLRRERFINLVIKSGKKLINFILIHIKLFFGCWLIARVCSREDTRRRSSVIPVGATQQGIDIVLIKISILFRSRHLQSSFLIFPSEQEIDVVLVDNLIAFCLFRRYRGSGTYAAKQGVDIRLIKLARVLVVARRFFLGCGSGVVKIEAAAQQGVDIVLLKLARVVVVRGFCRIGRSSVVKIEAAAQQCINVVLIEVARGIVVVRGHCLIRLGVVKIQAAAQQGIDIVLVQFSRAIIVLPGLIRCCRRIPESRTAAQQGINVFLVQFA